MRFVVDASVIASWLLDDESSEYANGVWSRLRNDIAIAPPIWVSEVANAIRSADRQGRLSAFQLNGAISAALALPINSVPVESEEILGPVLSLATSESMTVYDATYLHAAIREHIPIATLDQRMRAALANVGLELLAP